MTEKQETLRDLLRQWKEAAQMLKNVPIVSDMDPVCREAIRQLEGRSAELAPIVERLEDTRELCDELREADLSKTNPNSVADLVGNRLREVLGRKD